MATVFPFSPDWSDDVIERLSWLTDVIPQDGGGEQRVQLREGARRTLEYSVKPIGDRERVLASHIIAAAGGEAMLLPQWLDAPWVTAKAAAGASSVSVHSTTDHAVSIGGQVALLEAGRYETAVVQALATGAVGLTLPLASEWPAGARLAPLASAWLQPEGRMIYPADSVGRMTLTWEIDGEWIGVAAAEAADYRGYPVLLPQTDWSDEVGDDLTRDLLVFDSETGLRSRTLTTGLLTAQRVHRWTLKGRPAIAAFKAWLAARAGRLNPIWHPSNQADVLPVEAIGAAATTLVCEDRGLWRLFAGGQKPGAVGRRDLMIVSTAGTRWYRRVTNAVQLSGGREQLTIDSALGTALATSAVALVSLMRLVRLAADTVEIAYKSDDTAKCALGLASLRDGTTTP
ncbi:hypothetical protein CKO44_16140 [Rubrivivax gelatinosus]|uniref:hypothetical protein n=1 Tax=Rubrivivax gelatinosus TaxID=28068 RepID=UPI001906CC38|nr:hypothetical protein [Rubrivivax gelatinosus]MBK1615000.1 hypothetical protein [Rubrivivax gelatinosus]